MNYTIRLPLAIKPSKKWFYVNLNNYRNLHPFLLNKSKIMYKDVIQRQIDASPIFSKVRLTYTYFPRDARKSDLGNVCSVHDKFFSDAFVEAGKLADDNHTYIPEILFRFGSIDKKHPRVEVLIEQIGEPMTETETQLEQDQMQITLDETEIHEAIKAYVRSQITVQSDQTIDIDMKAGRGESGFSATLNIRHAGSKAPQATQEAPQEPSSSPETTKPSVLNFGNTQPSQGSSANISTGDERVEPQPQLEQEQEQEEAFTETFTEEAPVSATGSNPFGGEDEGLSEPEPQPETEAPAKPKSIFSFATKTE